MTASPLKLVTDGWQNLLTNMGIYGKDKRLSTTVNEPLKLSQAELNMMYRGDDIVARVCNLPASEMTRKGFEIQVDDKDKKDLAEVVHDRLKELGTMAAFNEAITWSRLHGGSVILMGVDDGQDMEQPLNEENIKGLNFLSVLDRWELEVVSTYAQAGEAKYRQPEVYRIRQHAQVGTLPSEMGADPHIHETRLLRFDGVLTPAIDKLGNQGWNDGVVTRLYEVIRDFQSTYAGAALLMQNLGETWFRMKGLAASLAHDKENLILTRLQIMNVARSVARMIPMDADEEIIAPNQRIQGLETALNKFDTRLSMAVGWPTTVLFGQSPKGLNATGESDLSNWYDYIEGERDRIMTDNLRRLIKIAFLVEGDEPEGWGIKYAPLWQESKKEQADTKLAYAQADAINIDRGVYTPEEVANSRYGGDEFGTDITLDEELRSMDLIPSALPEPEPDPEIDPEPDPEPDPDLDSVRQDKIEKRGSKWVVLSEAGKLLGTHSSKKKAEEQLRAIEASKRA